jgi:hypothetical protein
VDSTNESAVAGDQAATGSGKSKPAKGEEFTALPANSEQAKQEAIQVHQSGALQSGAIEVAETISQAGIRPIAVSHLEIYGTILNNRPIEASNLTVLDTNSIPGHRPIFASELHVLDTMSLPGHRPIVASDPQLLEASTLPGGRPIASNELDDSATLMGFLD